jgi:hypothetical protein
MDGRKPSVFCQHKSYCGEGSTTNPDYHVYNYDGTNVAEAKATNNYKPM